MSGFEQPEPPAAMDSRCSTFHGARSPASEDSDLLPRLAVTALPFAGDMHGKGGVFSNLEFMAIAIRSFWRRQRRLVPDQWLV
jgi:hypothetical protein